MPCPLDLPKRPSSPWARAFPAPISIRTKISGRLFPMPEIALLAPKVCVPHRERHDDGQRRRWRSHLRSRSSPTLFPRRLHASGLPLTTMMQNQKKIPPGPVPSTQPPRLRAGSPTPSLGTQRTLPAPLATRPVEREMQVFRTPQSFIQTITRQPLV